MAFRSSSQNERVPASPELLFRELARSPGAASSLWVHQGDVLREYAARFKDERDLAIELPTGTGKTLPGLLIADWNRRSRQSQVVFACPTRQLARQVHAAARREGIPAVLLVGSYRDWDPRDVASYVSAQAVAISTYSSVFNSHPKLEQPSVIIFDDAHAGEQYVAQAYSVVIDRDSRADYDRVLKAVAPALDGTFVERLREDTPDTQIVGDVRLVLPLRNPSIRDQLDTALASLSGSSSFSFSMIRAGLSSCLVHVAYGSIAVRPLLPPTDDNHCFAGAAQRIYLTATLGVGGEIERAFGRKKITRVRLPESAAAPRAGRRFFVFANLAEPGEGARLTQEIVALAGKALVLTQDNKTARKLIAELGQPAWPVFMREDIENGFDGFVAAPHAICGLANRYDGIDLPGDACRLVVMSGLPDADSLHERFLVRRAKVGVALAQRIRARVVQGFGRCTRGPNDWAIVVVASDDITRYLLRPEVLAALDDEVRAEILLGVENSKIAVSEVLENAASFLAQDEAWRGDGEAALASFRTGALPEVTEAATAIAAAVPAEVEACALARIGQWKRASESLYSAAQALASGGEIARPYRGFLLYLASVWMDQAGEVEADEALRQSARSLIRRSEETALPTRWIGEMARLPDDDQAALAPSDAQAVASIASALAAGVREGRHNAQVDEMLSGLAQTSATSYEPALTVLGQLLGADAQKPSGNGRCDSTWCWGNVLWVAIEAKSEHEPSGLVQQKDLRQANDQLRLLAQDRSVAAPPVESATVIVSPKRAVDPSCAASAEGHVHLLHPDGVLEIARDAAALWRELIPARHGRDEATLRALVARTLAQHGCLPGQVFERLTGNPIG